MTTEIKGKVLETQGYRFSFTLPNVDRSVLLTNEKFNYGGGSFYQKFKNHVNVEGHDGLKAIKDADVYMKDNFGDTFEFFTTNTDEFDVRNTALVLLNLCKDIHKFEGKVSISFSRTILVEETLPEYVVE